MADLHVWTLETVLAWMREKGSSVSLNWGEDNNCWEASWITGGQRFVGVSNGPLQALCKACNKAMEHLKEKK